MKRSQPGLTVVDVNVMRDRSIIRGLLKEAAAGGRLVALPEVAVSEMVKGEHGLSSLRRSLRHFAGRPEGVVLLESRRDTMLREFDTAKPARVVVDQASTEWLRDLILDFHCQGGPQVEALRRGLPDYSARARRFRFDDSWNKERLLGTVERFVEILPSGARKTLRRGNEAAAIAALAGPAGAHQVFATLTPSEGLVEPRVAFELAVSNSFAAARILSWMHLGMHWIARGGVEGLNAKKATNEWIDCEYVVHGAMAGSLVSKEKEVEYRFEVLREILKERRRVDLRGGLLRAFDEFGWPEGFSDDAGSAP